MDISEIEMAIIEGIPHLVKQVTHEIVEGNIILEIQPVNAVYSYYQTKEGVIQKLKEYIKELTGIDAEYVGDGAYGLRFKLKL